jgi:hypothetical protein
MKTMTSLNLKLRHFKVAPTVRVDTLLFLIVIFLFREYVFGKSTPPWDFWSQYLTDAGYWWTNFSIFHQINYFPNLYSGYPSHIAPQSSAWYLPVGVIVFIFQKFSPHEAALLQALTIFFGVVGVRKLCTKLNFGVGLSFVAALAYTFNPGFIGNAQHTDIVRGWAFFPWALLLLMPRQNLTKKFVAISSFFWFQFLVGVYPGQIIAFFYILGIWLLVTHINNFKQIAIPAVPALIGLILSLEKWLPYLASVSNGTVIVPATVFNWTNTLSVLFPFKDPIFLNDISMRSYFVIPCLFLGIFLGALQRKSIPILSIFLMAMLLGTYQNFLVEKLPFLTESRFRHSDFKPAITLSLTILGIYGVERILQATKDTKSSIKSREAVVVINLVLWMLVVISLLFFGRKANLEYSNYLIGTASLLLGLLPLLIIILFGVISKYESRWADYSWVLIALSVFASGTMYLQTSPTWKVPIQVTEEYIWGTYPIEFDQRVRPLDFRPARTGPDFPSNLEEMNSIKWNIAAMNNGYSVGGYVNLKRQPSYEYIQNIIMSPDAANLLNTLKRESIAWTVPVFQNSGLLVADCIESKKCDNKKNQVSSWLPGRINVRVNSEMDQKLVVNEIAYPGWKVRTCDSKTRCKVFDVPSGADNFFLSAPVNSSTSSAEFFFQTPYLILTRVMIFGTLLIMLLVYACVKLVGIRRRSCTNRT